MIQKSLKKEGAEDKIDYVNIEAKVETSGSQEDLDKWVEKGLNSCPVHQIMNAAGIKVDSKWKNIKTLQ